jgi:hypothetical protein
MKPLKNEKEIASVKGANVSVSLTNKRIISTIGSDNSGEIRTIPLENLDSVAFRSSHYVVLLVLGIIAILYGLVLRSNHNSDSTGLIIIGGLFFASWWFTRKVGAFIYSLSGKNEIFISASARNKKAIIDFLDEIQSAFDNK